MMRFETRNERRPLSGRTDARGSQTGMTGAGAWIFGGIFVAAGTGIMLIGMKIIPVDPRSVHAPYWVLTAIGAVFALAGCAIWGMGWKQRRIETRRLAAMNQNPGVPAFVDHPWDPQCSVSSGTATAARQLGIAAFITLFLTPFNVVFAQEDVPWFVLGIIGLFDLIAVLLWTGGILAFGRALKFGRSRVLFGRFPCRRSEPIVLRWEPAAGIGTATGGSFTLRCVREWHETSGSGKNRSTKLVHEEQASGTWRLDTPHEFRAEPALPFELSFTMPPDLPPTQLNSTCPTFWELEVTLDLPGLDFTESYLIPVY